MDTLFDDKYYAASDVESDLEAEKDINMQLLNDDAKLDKIGELSDVEVDDIVEEEDLSKIDDQAFIAKQKAKKEK